jgi:hypothetical protein
MIRDSRNRKWFLRFKQYKQGWSWEARCGAHGQGSGFNFFATRALAEADARRSIQSGDAIASGKEYFRLLKMRGGMECQLTAEDWAAIERA